MKTIALITGGVVTTTALWDGLAVWRPLAAGLATTTVDITGSAVGAGWTWNAASNTFSSAGQTAAVVLSAAVNPTQ